MKELKNPTLFVIREGDGSKIKDCIVREIPMLMGDNKRSLDEMKDDAERFIKGEITCNPLEKFYAIYGEAMISQTEIVVKLV